MYLFFHDINVEQLENFTMRNFTYFINTVNLT